MEPLSAVADREYAALVRVADRLVVGLDFDGTLSPIVEDPTAAAIHPDVPDMLVELARRVRAVAVITGRPSRQAVALGGLDEVGDRVDEHGRELFVLGQYGHERWTSAHRQVLSPPPPAGLAHVLAALPGLVERSGLEGVWIEEKGLAVAVHTRRSPDPSAAMATLTPQLTDLAHRHGLEIEPGRMVVEIRAASMDKGIAADALMAELDGGAFLFAGDDLGDLEAYRAGLRMRERGLPVLLVYSGSGQASLVELADVAVDGPAGVVELLSRLAADIAAART